jgi:hypothetical protein
MTRRPVPCPACGGAGAQKVEAYRVTTGNGERFYAGVVVLCPACFGERTIEVGVVTPETKTETPELLN